MCIRDRSTTSAMTAGSLIASPAAGSRGALRQPQARRPRPDRDLVVMAASSAPSRPRRPALALSAFPDTLSRLYRVPRACWAGSRRATSHAGSSRAASSKTRAERRRAWRARPHARGRRQGRRASWRLCQARTCQKTPRSARHVTEAARLGAARAAGRRRHQARGRRAPPNRQGRRGSREHSTAIPFLWRAINSAG